MVTPEDIAVELGRSTPDEDSPLFKQWSLWISDAYQAIRWRAERLGIEFSSLDVAKVDYVVRQAVLAHARRPDDSTQVDVAIDDGRVSKRFSSSTGRVVIDDDWWDELGLTSASDAFTIFPYGEVRPPHRVV